MTEDEILKQFGVTDDQLEVWEEDATKGILHGKPREIVVGRPRLSDEPRRAVTITMPISMLDKIDKKSKNRSSFIRDAVAACL